MLLVGRLFEVGKVMLRELNNKDFREFMTTIAGSEDILEVMEYILQGFVQQQNCKWLFLRTKYNLILTDLRPVFKALLA